jgi:hypothetical protein
MRIPDRFRDPAALVEACVFGVAGAAVTLMWPWPWLVLAAVAGPLIFVVVLVIATWPRRPPPRPPDPPPPPPRPESATAAKDAADLVKEWGQNLPEGSPARTHAGKVVELAGDVVNLIVRCRREIRDDGASDEKLGTFTSYFTAYVNTSRPPQEPADWKELEEHFEWIMRELRELVEQPRGA